MTDLEQQAGEIICMQGNKEEFLLLLAALVYFDSDRSSIEVRCYAEKHTVYQNIANYSIYMIIKHLCAYFQPRFEPAYHNRTPKGWLIPFYVKSKNFYQYFISARERINAKLWIMKTLEKYQIAPEIIENL